MVKIGNKKKFFFKKIWVDTWYNKFVKLDYAKKL